MGNCPIDAAHSRLMDVHELIHRALENYFDPTEFRRNLNNALQESRNVTWLLQKKKEGFENFDDFYGQWQRDVQNNPIMRWSVGARNQVTKESDLVKSSKLVATVFTEKSILDEKSFEVSPFLSTADCISLVLKGRGAAENLNELVLRIERLWIAETLPQVELTDALIEIHRNLTKIIRQAHTELGLEDCGLADQKRTCVTHNLDYHSECFGTERGIRSIAVSLKTGERLTIRQHVIERNDSILPELMKHYGKTKVDELSNDPYEQAFDRLDMLRMFVSKDGSTMPFLLIHGINGEGKMFMLPMVSDSSQSLLIKETLSTLGAWPFSTITFSTETWLSNTKPKSEIFGIDEKELLPSSSEFNQSKFGERAIDAIAIYVLDQNSPPFILLQPFANTTNGVVFGPVIKSHDWRSVPDSLKQIFPQRDSAI